jgi:peptide/nickel transport system substrate-binding protein
VVSRTWATKNGDWDGQEVNWKKFNNPSKESSPFFERANGTGPFRLERWDRKNKEILLLRNELYWRTPAKLKNVVIKGVNEFGTRKLMLQAGDADSIYAHRPLLSQLQGIPGVKIIDDLPTIEMSPVIFFTYQINPTANAYIGSGKFDGNGIPPVFFSDKDVRKAFAYAFDYNGFISDVLRGKGTQARGVIPKSLPGYAAAQETYSLNLKKSEDYFKKAHGGKLWEKGFRFTLAYNSGNVERQSVCQIIKRNIENLNPKFKVELRAIEWPSFLDAQKASKLPLFVLGWVADYPDAHSFTFPMLHSKGEFTQFQHFKDATMDYLIEEGEKETRLAKRKALYARLQALAYEEVPHLLIADKAVFRTQREWVKGYTHNPIFPDAPYSAYYYPMYKK